MSIINEAQWLSYEQEGYLRLGSVLDENELKKLQDEIDLIMTGKADVPYEKLLMQLDSSDGKYENAGAMTKGWKGETLAYRKIQELEHDPLFLEFMQRPIFQEICAKIYGETTPVASFRAMFMNKPARQGTLLPWHQDRWTDLNRDPLITLWTALDPATKENGCVQVIPRSHKLGLINPSHPSAFLTEEQAQQHTCESETVYLEMAAGESVLLHNWLLHRSDTNATDTPRRAFSVCYMDGKTISSSGTVFHQVF